MAEVLHTAPQQPGLRPFIICDRMPEGCIAYPVTDSRYDPMLRAGEWVIVDPEDREPVEGELFVVQWRSGGGPMVVECMQMAKLSDQWGQPAWAVGTRHRGWNAKEVGWGVPGNIVGDFPYKSPQLTERFLGKVVGIYDAAVVEPERIAA